MKLIVAWIGKTKDPAVEEITNKYLKRLNYYADTDGVSLRDENKLLDLCAGKKRAVKPILIALDSRGSQLSSEDLSGFLRKHQGQGTGSLLFAVGGADGLSDQVQKSAGFRLSLGKMTLAHDLARIVLLEQLYRAFTILEGHPYHTGH